MDIFKILLVYMTMAVTVPAQQVPDLTPPPVTSAPIVEEVTVTPAPAPVEEIVYETLRPGNSGKRVQEMQEKLIELGFLTGKADGQYGQQTKEAVTRYQRYVGLTADGIAGNATLSRLYSQEPMVTPTPPPSVIPAAMVKVYYVDKDTGIQLYAMDMTCYGSTVLYANGNLVPEGYRLAGDDSVSVTIQNNRAEPGSVTFYYTAPVQETSPDAPLYAPVEGTVLIDGAKKSLSWFEDDQGNLWLPLTEDLFGMEIPFNRPFTIFDKNVVMVTEGALLQSVTMNEQPCTEQVRMLNGIPHVSVDFLALAGITAAQTEGTLSITLPGQAQ